MKEDTRGTVLKGDEFSERDTDIMAYVTGGLAHDLNNLLSPILLGVQTLQRNDPDDKTKRILTMIEQSSRKAAEMVRRVLDHARKSQTHVQLLTGPRIAELMRDVATSFPDATCTVQRGSDVDKYCVSVDSHVLRLVGECLFQNAVEASESTARVECDVDVCVIDEDYKRRFRSARAGVFVRLQVRDHGSGVAEELLGKLTEPFFTTRGDLRHSGLGLFLVSQFVKRHEGFMEIESTLDSGTSVRVYIPCTT